MAETIKITNADILTMIEEIAVGTANEEAILGYCAKQKESLANKAAKAKERAAEKRAAGDDLRDAVQAILEAATEPMTREMILAAFDNAEELELTVGKVGNRASELVRFNLAHKVDVKTEDGKTKVGYVIGGVDAE
jgi:hypothetical protein